MAKRTQAEISEFIDAVQAEIPTATAADLAELCRLARRHGKLQEKACNEEVPENHDAKCEADITALCAKIGLTRVIFGGDPRGYTVKVVLPSGRSNSWGGEGWGVPQ